MNQITVGDYMVNLDAIAWANMNASWKNDVPVYENGTRIGLDWAMTGGVMLRFVDGSILSIPNGTPGIKFLRTILNPDGRKESTLDAFTPEEANVIIGLPEDLRAAILKGEQ